MRNAFKIWLASALLALTVLGCENSVQNPAKRVSLEIGAVLPLSGRYAKIGESARAALNFAKEKLESEKNADINLTFFDDSSSVGGVLKATESIKETGIRIVIGPFLDDNLLAAKDFAKNDSILFVSPYSFASSLSEANDNIYRLSPGSEIMAKAFAALISKDSIRAIYALVKNDAAGNNLYADLFGEVETLVSTVEFFKYDSAEDLSDKRSFFAAALRDGASEFGESRLAVCFFGGMEILDFCESAKKLVSFDSVLFLGSPLLRVAEAEKIGGVLGDSSRFYCAEFVPALEDKSLWENLSSFLKSEGFETFGSSFAASDALKIAAQASQSANPENDYANFKKEFFNRANFFYGTTGLCSLNENGDRQNAAIGYWTIEKIDDKFEWRLKAEFDSKTNKIIPR